jgi:hypothetical protein
VSSCSTVPVRPLNVNARRHVLSLCSPAFQLPGPGDVDWLVVDLKDRKDTDLLPLFPVCNAFMLQCRMTRHVVLVAAVFGGGNASSALLAAFVMASNRESYAAAVECIGSAAPKAVPHASHFVEQLELSAPKSPPPPSPSAAASPTRGVCRYATLGSAMGGHR